MQTDHNAGPTISTHLQQPLPLSNQDQAVLHTHLSPVTNYFDDEKKIVHSHNSPLSSTGQEELLLFGYSDQNLEDQQIDKSLAQQEQPNIKQSEYDTNFIKKDLVQSNNNFNLKQNNLQKNNCDENKQFTDSSNLSKSDHIFFIKMNEQEKTQSILEQIESRNETEQIEIQDLPVQLNNLDEEDKLERVQSTEQEPNSQVSEERTGSTIKSESNLSSPEVDPLFGNADRSSGSQEALQDQNINARMPAVAFTLDDPLLNLFEEHQPQKQSITTDQVKKDYSTLSKCFKVLLSSQFIQKLITVQRNFSELEIILLDMADQLLLNELKTCTSFLKPGYDATNFFNNEEHLNVDILEFALFEGFSIQQILLAIDELSDNAQIIETLKEVLNSYQEWSLQGQQPNQNNTIFQKKAQEFLFHIDEKNLTFQQFKKKIIQQEPEVIQNDEVMSQTNFELEEDQEENEKQKIQWNDSLNPSFGRTELNFDEDEEFEKDLNIDNSEQDSEGGKKEEPEEEDEEGVIIEEENKRDDYNKPKEDLQQVQLSKNDWQPLERFRAKLYTLGSFGKWSDRGTGHFMIDQIEPGQYKMILLKEDSGEDLLIDEYIKPNIIFDKQRETIITWADKESAKDLAVSFQAAQGAAFSWLKICQIQGRDPELNQVEPPEADTDPEDNQPFSLEQLPNLAQEFKLNSTFDPEQKQDLIDSLLSNDGQNLVRLGELFEECEREVNNCEKPASEYLLYFFFIYKGLIQFNDQHLLEILLSDRFYLDTFGALEWDPDGLDEVEESQINEESLSKQVNNLQDQNIKYEEDEEDEIEETNQKRDLYIDESKSGIKGNEFQENQDVKDEQGCEDQKDDNKLVYYHFSTLNYRDFLERSVKFKKLIDFKDPFKKQEESKRSESGRLNIQTSFDIEERIHMNYRLQFLRDTVMARYIDEQVQKSINQLIASNNREIVGAIFGLPNYSQNTNLNNNEYGQNNEYQGFIFSGNSYQRGSQVNGAQQIPERGIQTIKDLVLQKIRSKTDIKGKYMAIEFMIELCQILKNLQFQPGLMSGTNSFLYGNNNNNMAFNNRQIIDQLNQAAVIGALAETMNILVPDYEILQTKIKEGQQQFLLSQGEESSQDYHEKYINLLRLKNPQITEQKVLEDLLEYQQDHNNQTNFETKGKRSLQQSYEFNSWDRISRLDQMKINSLEILISFYQSPNLPSLDINKFIFGQDQHQPHTSRGMQFLNNMLSHLFFSSEQGIKLQVADFFKSLLEPDGTSIQHKRQIYEVVLKRLVDFLKFLTSSDNFDTEIAHLKMLREFQMNEEIFDDNEQQWPTSINLFKNMEYSAQLVMQLISRCVAEHRYPFKDFFIRYQIVGLPTKLRKFNSKLLDIEIVKFYKSLFRAKDPSYIQMISQKNLFVETILDLFKETYRKRNPPLIQSCLRDLFDSIFKQNLGGKQQISTNDLFSPSFVQYLTKFNPSAQNILFDDYYSCVFGRYNLTKTYSTINQQQGNNRFNNQISSNVNQQQQEQEFIQIEINSNSQNKQITNQAQKEIINDNNHYEKEDKCQKQQSSPISSQGSLELEVFQSAEESKSELQQLSQSDQTILNQITQQSISYQTKKFRSKLGIDEDEVIKVNKFYKSNQSEKNMQEISKLNESCNQYDFQINLNQELTPQHSEQESDSLQNKCEVIRSIDLERESENENSSESSQYSDQEEDQQNQDEQLTKLTESQIGENEQKHLGKRRSKDNQQVIQKRQKTEQ